MECLDALTVTASQHMHCLEYGILSNSLNEHAVSAAIFRIPAASSSRDSGGHSTHTAAFDMHKPWNKGPQPLWDFVKWGRRGNILGCGAWCSLVGSVVSL